MCIMTSASRKKTPSPAGTQAIRILIADDFTVVREGLASMINRQPDMRVVAEASDGQAAVELYGIHRPDIVFLDVRMPRLDGIAAVKAIRTLDPEARVILLSTYGGDELVYQGLRAGAKGYLMKDIPRQDLWDTIRKVYRGDTYLLPAIAAKLADRVTRSELSARELEVLRLMVVGKSNKEIGVALCVTEGTVKVHVGNLLKKLKATGRGEAINLALMHGIVSLESASESADRPLVAAPRSQKESRKA
jgi:two-component system NarL family response regulator